MESNHKGVESLLIGAMCRKASTDEGGLAEVIASVDISAIDYQSIDNLLATKTGSQMKGAVSLIVENYVHFERRGRRLFMDGFRRYFANKVQNRHWIIALADCSYYGSSPSIFERQTRIHDSGNSRL